MLTRWLLLIILAYSIAAFRRRRRPPNLGSRSNYWWRLASPYNWGRRRCAAMIRFLERCYFLRLDRRRRLNLLRKYGTTNPIRFTSKLFYPHLSPSTVWPPRTPSPPKNRRRISFLCCAYLNNVTIQPTRSLLCRLGSRIRVEVKKARGKTISLCPYWNGEVHKYLNAK